MRDFKNYKNCFIQLICKNFALVSPLISPESFRKIGYNPITAICEVIDNSIDAQAKNIDIKFEWCEKKSRTKFRSVKKFVFIDDGNGMDEKSIVSFFTVGNSSQNQKGELKKFGGGAFLAGLSQARRIEVFSKIKGGKWCYSFYDLDIVDQEFQVPMVAKPVLKEPPKEFLKSLKHGTVVVWNNVDNFEFKENHVFPPEKTNHVKPLDIHDEEILSTEISRIYRKFLADKKIHHGKIVHNNKIKIKIQNVEIEPYDPLYLSFNPKKDDESPKMVSQDLKIDGPYGPTKIWITFSFFPKSWWRDILHPGLDLINRIERKIGTRNDGVSIVREGRELFFGIMPCIIKESKAMDRFLGIEIEFFADSDDNFGIGINKSNFKIHKEICKRISQYLKPTIEENHKYFQKCRNDYLKERYRK